MYQAIRCCLFFFELSFCLEHIRGWSYYIIQPCAEGMLLAAVVFFFFFSHRSEAIVLHTKQFREGFFFFSRPANGRQGQLRSSACSTSAPAQLRARDTHAMIAILHHLQQYIKHMPTMPENPQTTHSYRVHLLPLHTCFACSQAPLLCCIIPVVRVKKQKKLLLFLLL